MVPNQNLINPTRLSEITREPGYWKSTALDLLSLLSALATGYTYYFYITTGLSPWYLFGAFLAFAACSSLQVFLAPKSWRRVIVIVGEALCLTIWFYFFESWQAVAIAGGTLFVLLQWGYFSSRSDMKNSVEVRFFGVTSAVLGKVVTGLLLFAIIVYAPQAEGQRAFVPRQNFQAFFSWSVGYIENFYPAFDLTTTFGSFAESVAKSQVKGNASFENLSPTQQSAAIDQMVQSLADSVKTATGVAPAASQALSDVAYDYIVATINGWRAQFGGQFMLVWGIALFLALRTVGVFLVWIAQFVSLVFYELLLALGFMHIGESTQTQEVVQY